MRFLFLEQRVRTLREFEKPNPLFQVGLIGGLVFLHCCPN